MVEILPGPSLDAEKVSVPLGLVDIETTLLLPVDTKRVVVGLEDDLLFPNYPESLRYLEKDVDPRIIVGKSDLFVGDGPLDKAQNLDTAVVRFFCVHFSYLGERYDAFPEFFADPYPLGVFVSGEIDEDLCPEERNRI